MPLHCTVRPNRKQPRHWTAKAAARAVCSALDHGALRADIERHVEECDLSRKVRPKVGSQSLLGAFEQAEVALSDSNTLFVEQATALTRMLAVLGILVVIGRFLQLIPNPGAKVVAAGSGALKAVAETQLKQIAAQQIANDFAIAVIRRAAASARAEEGAAVL